MGNGFYKELKELRKEEDCEDADFSFMENDQHWSDEMIAELCMKSKTRDKAALLSVMNRYKK